MSESMKRVSIGLQDVAAKLSEHLNSLAGTPVAFVLLVSVDNTVQYVSNAAREDGKLLIESQLDHWKRGRADIPGHYNPDLKDK